MKKTLALLVSLILIFGIGVTASAASAAVSLSGVPSELKKDERATVTVSLANSPAVDSALIQITLDKGLELVSGEWKTGGMIEDFNVSEGEGVMTVTAAKAFNGTIFSFVVSGKTVSAAAQGITVKLTLKNGTTVVGTASATKSVKIDCASHTFGSYSKVNDSTHKRVCSACGYEETANHNWNGGTVTKQASCKEAGNRKYACTACGAERNEAIAKTNNHIWGNWNTTKNPTCTATGTATKTCSVCGKTENQTINATGHSMGAWTQSKAPSCTANGEEKRSCSKCGHSETKAIAALGHSFSHPTVTKEPTCTETGIESGKCTRCGQTTTNTIKAKGHKFGGWNDTKAATCTEGGTQERKCSACNAVETRNTDALGHDFENPTIIKEATISETGLKEGKCKRCGETTSEVIPCSAKDETTGTSFETSEGVFGAGTQLTVEEIKTDNPTFDSAKNILKDVCKEFKLYNISALQNGAAVTPNGEVKTTFTIPEGFGKNVALYLIKADGTSEKIEAETSEDGTTLTAKLTTLGDYAICKLGSAEGKTEKSAKNGEKTSPKTKSNAVLYVIISAAAVLIIGGGATAFIIIKKKRKTV